MAIVPLAFANAVDLGHGRGRASARAAASIWRIDAILGRPADINEAWRSPEQADANRAAWIRYQNGGPIAPYALGAEDSVHCAGDAADSDDWYNAAAAAVWRRGGWRQTARYPGSSKDEPWHGEHFPYLDELAGQFATDGSVAFPEGEEDVPLTKADAVLVAQTLLNMPAYDNAVRADRDGGQPLTVSQALKDLYEVLVFGGAMLPDNGRPARDSLDGIVKWLDGKGNGAINTLGYLRAAIDDLEEDDDAPVVPPVVTPPKA